MSCFLAWLWFLICFVIFCVLFYKLCRAIYYFCKSKKAGISSETKISLIGNAKTQASWLLYYRFLYSLLGLFMTVMFSFTFWFAKSYTITTYTALLLLFGYSGIGFISLWLGVLCGISKFEKFRALILTPIYLLIFGSS